MDKFMDFWIKRIGFWGACCVTAVFMAIFGIGGIVCVIVGRIFLADPESVNVVSNGRVLEGAEAVEAAIRAGNVLSLIGGVLLGLALIILVAVIVFAILYGKMYKPSNR